MKKNFFKISSLLFASVVIFSSCKKDDENKPKGEFSSATFVVCEGNYGSNDADIYAITEDGIQQDIFSAVNGRPLGDVVNSMKVIGDKAYIVVNNSQKVEVVDVNTFESEGTIKNLSYPRYVEKRNSNEIFVSNGNGYGSDYVYVINTTSLEKVDSVATGAGPNAMVVTSGKLYVANMGGYSHDNTVTVINVESLEVEKTIMVGDVPADLELDNNGDVLVFCKGLTNYNYDTEGNYVGSEVVSNSSIVKIDETALTTTTVKDFDHQVACYGENVMAYNNGTIYYLDGGLVSMNENGASITTIAEDANVYGVSIDSNEKDIWVLSTPYGTAHTATLYEANGTISYTEKVGNYPKMVVSK